MEFKFSFVILHYKTIEDTIECVDSIEKLNIDYHEIIIVDNFSDNGTYEMLKNKYNNNIKIMVYKTNKNLGFAKGNNEGYRIARKRGANFINIINNDTFIKDRLYITSIFKKYEELNFDIGGTQIISVKDNENQNTQKYKFLNVKKLNIMIIKNIILCILNGLRLDNIFLKVYIKTKMKKYGNKKIEDKEKILINEQLHGASLIFSPNYIEKYNNAFWGDTFLYMEEDILMYFAKENNLKVLYTDCTQIYHKEDSSTDFICNSDFKKRRFKYINVIKSSLAFKKFIKLGI